MKRKLSIVIPAYNSSASIPMLFERLSKVLPTLNLEWEIVIVNDGSRDNTWEVIQRESLAFPNIVAINLLRNYGQHNALLCGIRNASGDVIVTMDDDLQNPPEEIHKMLSKLNEGYDVVYGKPEKGQHGLFRNFASRLTKLVLQNVMNAETAENVSAFRIFHTRVRDAFADYRGSFVSLDVLLTWGAYKFTFITVKHDSRELGTSNYTLKKLVTHAINMFTGFTVLPLQLASLMGFVSAFLGIALFIYTLFKYFFVGVAVPGFTFLAASIALFSGAQLLALGVIGEYLARIHFRTMDKPTYGVKELLRNGREV